MNNSEQDQLSVLATGTVYGVAGRVFGRFVNLISSIIIARVLGPAVYGIYSLGYTIFRLCELLAPLGFDTGIIKYGFILSRKTSEELKGLFTYSLWIGSGFALLLGGIVFISSQWIALELFNTIELSVVLRWYAIALPFSALLAIASAITRLTQNLKYTAVIQDIGQPLVALLLVLSFLFTKINLTKVVLADFISYSLLAFVSLFVVKILFPSIGKKSLLSIPPPKDLYTFSVTSMFIIFVSSLTFWIDRIFLGGYLNPQDVGIYQAACQVNAIFAVLLGGFSRVLLPTFSFLHNQSDTEKLQEMFRVGTKWTFYIGLPIIAFLFLNASDSLGFLYSDVYRVGSVALLILLAGQFVNIATGAVGPLLTIGGYQNIMFFLSLAALSLNTFLSILLIPEFGVLGAAASNSLSVIFLYLGALGFVKIKMNLWPYDNRYAKGLAAVFLAIVFSLAIKAWMQAAPLLEVAVQGVVIAIVFIAMLYLLQFDKEDEVFIGMLRKRFHIGFQTGKNG